jgi:hypothetical protein
MIYSSENKEEMTFGVYFYKSIGDRWYKIILSIFIICIVSLLKVLCKKKINIYFSKYIHQILLNMVLITGLSYLRIHYIFKDHKVKALLIMVVFVYLVRTIMFFLILILICKKSRYESIVPTLLSALCS